ncbi:MAG: hypothetical protein ACLQPD_25565 [Desulfomonilaceae bacterium]
MSTNGFREDELVSRKMKINGEWQTRTFPVVGGRLRLTHEENDKLSLQTKLVSWDGQYAVFKCCAVTGKGEFIGYGTANTQRDSRLAESLVELAETRSIARALRFAGFGLEFTGAEEVSHVPASESEPERAANKVLYGNGNGKPETKPTANGQATSAQVRALWALTKKARYSEEDIESMLRPLKASNFQDLTRESASQLISSLQTEVAA